MTRDELAAWLQLTQAQGVGGETARRLLTAFGLPQAVLAHSAHTLRTLASAAQVHALLHPAPETLTLAETTWSWLHDDSDGLARCCIALGDARYPAALLALPDPPVLLYALGSLERLAQSHCLAIVGCRKPTPQGLAHARHFAKTFAQMGWSIVSGLALGIDGAAHEGALDGFDAQARVGAATVAVVGTGLDRVYPRQHRALAHQIAQQGGLLLSELPLGTQPLPHHFPQRNRLIAALSHGALVVEAAPQSGSLITARLAAEQGKEVFAIPGSIDAPQSRGCHALIKQGAKLVESAQDVLEELQHLPAPAALPAAGSDDSAALPDAPPPEGPHHALLSALGYAPSSLDALQARSGMDTAQLQATLLELELQGQLARLPGGLFQRVAQA